MADLNQLSSLQGLGLRTVSELQAGSKAKNDLGQEDFLELMIAQLRNQDPLKPMESGEFLTQIAQFSSVTGIQELQGSFQDLSDSLYSNQALQASGLVGRRVLAPTGIGRLEQGGEIAGAVDLPAATSQVVVSVMNSAGQLVRRMEMGPQVGGQAAFRWDGMTDDGEAAAPGQYFVSAEAQFDGKNAAVETLIAANVESVLLGRAGELVLNLEGVGPLEFSQVRQIM